MPSRHPPSLNLGGADPTRKYQVTSPESRHHLCDGLKDSTTIAKVHNLQSKEGGTGPGLAAVDEDVKRVGRTLDCTCFNQTPLHVLLVRKHTLQQCRHSVPLGSPLDIYEPVGWFKPTLVLKIVDVTNPTMRADGRKHRDPSASVRTSTSPSLIHPLISSCLHDTASTSIARISIKPSRVNQQ